MGLLSAFDPSLYNPTTAPQVPTGAPGTSSRTQALPSQPLSALPFGLGDVGAVGAEYREHVTAIDSFAKRAAVVLRAVRAGSPAAGACDRVADLAGQMAWHIPMVVQHERELDERAGRAAQQADRLNPFEAQSGTREQERAADAARPEAVFRDRVIASLDEISAVSFELMRLAGDVPESNHAAAGILLLGNLAAPLAWTRPADLAEATARGLARIACPEDDTTRPEVCYETPSGRVDLRAQVRLALARLSDRFGRECERHASVLQAAIDRDQAIAELIAGVLVEVLLLAVTGGLGNAALGVVTATTAATATTVAAEVAAASTETTASSLIRAYGKDLAKGLTKTALSKGVAYAPGEPAPDARSKSIAFVRSLARAFDTASEDLASALASLDDPALNGLRAAIDDITPMILRERLDPVVRSYRAEIEPIGESSSVPGFFSRRDTVNRAARIHTPVGAPRLALVAYTSDALPEARRGARAVAATAAALMDEHHANPGAIFDVPGDDFSRANLEAWIVQPYDEVEFIRWIEAPGMEAIAAPDAIDLPADRVRGLPFLGYLGIRDTPDAR